MVMIFCSARQVCKLDGTETEPFSPSTLMKLIGLHLISRQHSTFHIAGPAWGTSTSEAVSTQPESPLVGTC